MNQVFKVYHYNKDGRHLYPDSTETSPETVSRDAYHEVGSVLGYDADAVFDKLNYGALSQSLGVRSLSTGDILEDERGVLWFCQSIGWGETRWG